VWEAQKLHESNTFMQLSFHHRGSFIIAARVVIV
jgi:hypothetical protein